MAGWEPNSTYYKPQYQKIFRCLPFSKYQNPNLETGNKIIMPQSALTDIVDSGVKTPWFFKIQTYTSDSVSHCGVLQFDAEEGCVHFPEWMMQNLNIKEGDLVVLQNARATIGNFMKLQPHETAFTEVSNMRAILETSLRGFSCLSRGDTIVIKYNNRDYCINVLEVGVGGQDVINLIDTDCSVEFVQPLDYKEPEIVKNEEKIKVVFKHMGALKSSKVIDSQGIMEKKKFQAFSGVSRRIGSSST